VPGPLTEEQKARNSAACKKWRTANPGKHAESYKKWAQRHKGDRQAYYEARKAAGITQKVSRDYHIRNTYGLEPDFIAASLADQGGKCAICAKELTLNWTRHGGNHACIDHDHATGAFRSLLCDRCNSAIGQLRDSSALAHKAAEYLSRFGK